MGYYDWALWTSTISISNICAGIFSNSLAPVSCNMNASSSGGTGMGIIPAGANASNFQPSIPVIAGQKFVLLFSNSSGVNGTASFSITGTAQIASCGTVTAVQLNLAFNKEFSIYPNPFTDIITINNNDGKEKEITIYSSLGQKISSFLSSENSIKINTTEFIPSIYFIQVKWDDKTFLQKLIKE